MTDEPESREGNSDDYPLEEAARQNGAFTSPPRLNRGFEAYTRQPAHPAFDSNVHRNTHGVRPATAVSRRDRTFSNQTPNNQAPNNQPLSDRLHGQTVEGDRTFPLHTSPAAANSNAPKAHRSRWAWLLPWRQTVSDSQLPSATDTSHPPDALTPSANPLSNPLAYPSPGWSGGAPYPAYGPEMGDPAGTGTDVGVLVLPQPRFWQKQPYAAIAHLLLVASTFTGAWFFGILVAQVFPGHFDSPPFQERLLRKTSRLSHRLWHFSQLWQTPMAQTRIEAVPLPETGPISGPIALTPIERQPLIDELNAVETEVVTLDRRLQALERTVGKPPYQGADINSRINTLRAAIDPPVRESAEPEHTPVASDPNDTLLEVAQLRITLPSDALFAPGDSALKQSEILNQVLDQLVNYPGATVSIRSHSDDQVNAIASREYTLAQAQALAAYLQQPLAEQNRWISVGVGQTHPLTDNADALARQQNRRIEILVDTR